MTALLLLALICPAPTPAATPDDTRYASIRRHFDQHVRDMDCRYPGRQWRYSYSADGSTPTSTYGVGLCDHPDGPIAGLAGWACNGSTVLRYRARISDGRAVYSVVCETSVYTQAHLICEVSQ